VRRFLRVNYWISTGICIAVAVAGFVAVQFVIPRKEFQKSRRQDRDFEKSASDALKLVRSLEQDLKRC